MSVNRNVTVPVGKVPTDSLYGRQDVKSSLRCALFQGVLSEDRVLPRRLRRGASMTLVIEVDDARLMLARLIGDGKARTCHFGRVGLPRLISFGIRQDVKQHDQEHKGVACQNTYMPDLMISKMGWKWIRFSVSHDQGACRVEQSACDKGDP